MQVPSRTTGPWLRRFCMCCGENPVWQNGYRCLKCWVKVEREDDEQEGS